MMMMKVLILILMMSFVQCFEEIFIEITFDEEQMNGTLVVDLRKEISSLSSVMNIQGYQMKFIRPCLNLYFDGFQIRSQRIDREEVCRYELNCSFICHLFIQKEEMKFIKLKININDINDHQPRFIKKNYFYQILNEKPFHLQLEQAEDQDSSPLNSINNYYLEKSNIDDEFPFELNFNKDQHLLELILINDQKVKKDKYLLKLIVLDGQNQSDHCFLHIEMKEENLISPEFDLNLYQFYIQNRNERLIGQVNVKNVSRSNERIYYRLISSNNNFDSNLFHIDENNGKIFWNNFNELNKDFYEIFIEAFYLNYISTVTTVHIYLNSTVRSREENFIEILIPKLFQRNLNEISIKENCSIPLTILQIFISSSSSILEMNSSIENQNYFHLKQFDEQSFELILLHSFDYELIQTFYLHFSLQNSSLQKSIQIYIENINDCQPYFNQSRYQLQIQENHPIPFLLFTFQAFDQDHLDPLQYQIQDLNQQFFFINSTNGQFFITKSFDREIQTNYSFSICVFDQLYRTCSQVLLQILDQNDNICQFNSSFINIDIDENLPINTNLIQIQAFDPDEKENATLLYSFNSSTSFIKINSTSGLIQTTNNAFDYEVIQFYSILIRACDHFYLSPSFCCSIQLKININDLDDNPPFLIYPSTIDDVFIIDYSNQTMPQLKANDRDLTNQNRLIVFQIIGGSLNSSLTIDQHSGQLHLLSSSSLLLPLYGTLHLLLSSQTSLQLTLLIHDNQTNPQRFLQTIRQQQQSFQLFYFISISFLLLLLLLLSLIFVFFFFAKQRRKHRDDRLMNTPSTTTLSARSISNSTNKKLYETYYSFGESFLSPQPTQL